MQERVLPSFAGAAAGPRYSGFVQVMRLNLISPVSNPCVMSGMTSAPGAHTRVHVRNSASTFDAAACAAGLTLDGLGTGLEQPKEPLRSGPTGGSAPA